MLHLPPRILRVHVLLRDHLPQPLHERIHRTFGPHPLQHLAPDGLQDEHRDLAAPTQLLEDGHGLEQIRRYDDALVEHVPVEGGRGLGVLRSYAGGARDGRNSHRLVHRVQRLHRHAHEKGRVQLCVELRVDLYAKLHALRRLVGTVDGAISDALHHEVDLVGCRDSKRQHVQAQHVNLVAGGVWGNLLENREEFSELFSVVLRDWRGC
jgi:hypothetical protein